MLLITPTQAEYDAVKAPLRDLLAAGSLELVMCGMGPEAAAAFCRQLEARARLPKALVLVGVAGGLDPALAAGDVILASAALDEDGQRAPCAIIPLPGATTGPVLTVSRALRTTAEKAVGRDTGAVAVEMEAYPLAAWAAERRLPFVHARVILDPYDEPFPDMGDALDPFGRVQLGQVLQSLLAQPSLVVPFLRLLRGARAIGPALGRLAQTVVAASG